MKDLTTLDKYRVNERNIFGYTGDAGCGAFKVYINGRSFFVVASDGFGWEHVSVSPCNKKRKSCPTWDEMCAIKDMFFEEEETVIQYHPAKSEYVNMHPYCLHLWRPLGVDLPKPDKIMVGI